MPTKASLPNADTLAAIETSYVGSVDQVESIDAMLAGDEGAQVYRRLSAKIRTSRRGKRMCYRIPVNFSEALAKGWTVWMDPPMVCEELPNGDLRVIS